MKLISMTEFIETQEKRIPYEESGTVSELNRLFVRRAISYCRFLKQPLTVGMFFPSDENGKVLKRCGCISDYGCCKEEYYYQKAKEKVLFKGFYWDYEDKCLFYDFGGGGKWFFDIDDMENKTIENFGGIEAEIELEESAIKQIEF